MEMAGNKHVFHESEQTNTNNNTNSTISNERPVQRQSRIKCNLAVQTAVAFKKIRYVSDSEPHLKVAWFRFENGRFNPTCAVHTVKSKSDMGHIWAEKSDSGHLQLRSERSQSGLIPIRKCQIQCDLCCSHGQKQIVYESHMSEKIGFRSLAMTVWT